MGINEEVARAFGAHAAWKTRIIQAIHSGHCDHEPDVVSRDDRCAFGKWLHGETLPPTVRTTADYQDVVRLHADFHRCAGSALSKALDGRGSEAQAEVDTGAFAKAAAALSSALVNWQRHAATECSAYGRGSLRAACMAWKGRLSVAMWASIAIPLLTALAVVTYVNMGEIGVISDMRRMERVSELVSATSLAIHEFQKERGLSAIFSAKGDPKIGEARKAQIELSEPRRAALATAVANIRADAPPAIAERIQATEGAIAAMVALRQGVTAGTVRAPEILATYGAAIENMLALSDASLTLTSDGGVRNTASALNHLSRAKEYAGRERAMGGVVLSNPAILAQFRVPLIELGADQNENFEAFARIASPEQRTAFQETLDAPAVTGFPPLRRTMLAGLSKELSPEDWFAAATGRINVFKGLEDRMVSDMRQTVAATRTATLRHAIVFNALVLAVLLVGGVLVARLANSITRPVNTLTEAMRALATGNTGVTIPAIELANEVGEMARAVLVFQQQALAVEQMTAEQEQLRLKAMAEMADSIEGDAKAIHRAAQDISGAVESQAATSSEMSASVAEITSTTEELSSSSDQVAEYAMQVFRLADKTWQGSKSGAEAVDMVLGRMEEIGEDNKHSLKVIEDLGKRSKEISKIMQIIESVADQTKLIAFNAALEASSAGEAGKRFSVVASEIRRLADSVTNSAGEIGEKVSEIQESISHLVVTSEKGSERISAGVVESGRAVQILTELETTAHDSSTAAQQISLATQQQRTASGQVVVALREIVSASSQTADSISRISDVARNMTTLSDQLETLVNRYQLRTQASADS